MDISVYHFKSSLLMQFNPFSKNITWETMIPKESNNSLKNLSIYTQNVWFDAATCSDQRYEAIIQQIESINADIVCLQEVTANFMVKVSQNKFVQKTYYSSDYKLTTFDNWYGIILLVRKCLLVRFTKLPFLYSPMKRSLICAHIKSERLTGIIASAHFESGDLDVEIRKRQWQDSTEYILSENTDFAFMCGDFNIFNDALETEFLTNQLKWNDSWLQPNVSKEPKDLERNGITFGMFQPRFTLPLKRIDRILYQGKIPVNVVCIKTCGDEPLKSSLLDSLAIYPSDHLGVFGQFDLFTQ